MCIRHSSAACPGSPKPLYERAGGLPLSFPGGSTSRYIPSQVAASPATSALVCWAYQQRRLAPPQKVRGHAKQNPKCWTWYACLKDQSLICRQNVSKRRECKIQNMAFSNRQASGTDAPHKLRSSHKDGESLWPDDLSCQHWFPKRRHSALKQFKVSFSS